MDELKTKLDAIGVGPENAATYAACVMEILALVFGRDLQSGRLDGDSDVIMTNESEKSFWAFLRWEHSGARVLFRTRNAPKLEGDQLTEVESRLGGDLSSLGFLVTRIAPGVDEIERCYSIFKNSTPRKAILILCDSDLKALLELRDAGRDPVIYIQTLYRGFRSSVQ
jgi:hypothetical protein